MSAGSPTVLAAAVLCLAATVFFPGLSPALSQEAGAAAPGPVRPAELERWERLNPEARGRLREIYRRLQALPPAERERLLTRLRMMPPQERQRAIELARDRLRRRAQADAPLAGDAAPAPTARPRQAAPDQSPRPLAWLPPEARRRLEKLPPAERAQEMEKMIGRTVRRFSERLPPEMRERLQRFTRREQMELIRAYRETEALIKTFPDRAEESRLLALSPERLRRLASPEAELPEGVSAASWDRWRALRPVERQQVLRRLERLREERLRPSRGEAILPDGAQTGNPAGDRQ